MSHTRTLEISLEVFRRLQKLAVPLVDTNDTILTRLIDHWEALPPTAASILLPPSPEPNVWRSDRGDVLPVGETLRGWYQNEKFEATVEPGGLRFNGKTYGSLSAAGVAVKESKGTTGPAANTNGRTFWCIQDQLGKWISVQTYVARGKRAM